jgi:hypothetical protein
MSSDCMKAEYLGTTAGQRRLGFEPAGFLYA